MALSLFGCFFVFLFLKLSEIVQFVSASTCLGRRPVIFIPASFLSLLGKHSARNKKSRSGEAAGKTGRQEPDGGQVVVKRLLAGGREEWPLPWQVMPKSCLSN